MLAPEVARLINHLNRSSALTSEILHFADLNGDALINQSDVDLMADLILGLPLPARPITLEPANGRRSPGKK